MRKDGAFAIICEGPVKKEIFMKWIKAILLVMLAVGTMACSGNKKDEREVIIVPQPDPIIEIEAKKNQKLFKQTEKEILESMTLPDITYQYDSIRPPDYSYEILDKIVNVLQLQPNMKLIIEGNTDVVGDKDYNYWLGASRAAAMKSYLVSRGIQADRIRIHSYGADRPITLDNSKEGRLTNRRVHFVLTTREWNSLY